MDTDDKVIHNVAEDVAYKLADASEVAGEATIEAVDDIPPILEGNDI